jgi:hypothetical protein
MPTVESGKNFLGAGYWAKVKAKGKTHSGYSYRSRQEAVQVALTSANQNSK